MKNPVAAVRTDGRPSRITVGASARIAAGASARIIAGASAGASEDEPPEACSSSSPPYGKGRMSVRLVLPAAVGWQDSAPKALRFLTASAIPIGIAATVVLIAVLLLRRLVVRRHLAQRVSYDLLPTTTFSPNTEDVLRFAAQLARARPAASRLLPRRAASVRLRWHTGPDDLLRLTLEGPTNAASVLRHRTYAAVEIRKADPRATLAASHAAEAEPGSTG